MNATQLAEHGRDWSTLIAHYPHGYVECCVPNYAGQELVGIFGRTILDLSDAFLGARIETAAGAANFAARPSRENASA